MRLGHAANCSALGNVLNVLVWSQVVAAGVWAAAESWRARSRRSEPGGETRLTDDPSALVRTGIGDGRSGPGASVTAAPPRASPREAHLQVTEACGLPCASCHMTTRADGGHVPLDVLTARIDALAEAGVLRIALGGGEPLRHPELTAIAAHARALGLGVGVTTSGVGPDVDLDPLDQVNVSLDALGAGFARSRGYDGADAALRAIRRLVDRGTRVGVNLVLDRDNFDAVERTVAAAVAHGASDVQLLRLKPVGRAVAGYAARRLTPSQALAVWPLAQRLLAAHPDVTIRLDCAALPWLAAHAPDLDRLTAFGFRGCHGSTELVSVDVHGEAHPCSFAPLTGTTGERDAERARWASGVVDGPCASCSYRAICRGGCHAVAGALTGDRFAPDPECPRVQAWGSTVGPEARA